jgi:hypothetical protein
MGFGYFLSSLVVGSALLVEADKFAWALRRWWSWRCRRLAVFFRPLDLPPRASEGRRDLAHFRLAFGLGVAERARPLFTGFLNDLGMALGVNPRRPDGAACRLARAHLLTVASRRPATLWR